MRCIHAKKRKTRAFGKVTIDAPLARASSQTAEFSVTVDNKGNAENFRNDSRSWKSGSALDEGYKAL